MSKDDDEDYIYIKYRPLTDYFACRTHSDDMKYAGILSKSVLICHKQTTAKDGDIIVGLLNNIFVVRRYKTYGDFILLVPENFKKFPIPVFKDDNFKILGKVIEFRYQFDFDKF